MTTPDKTSDVDFFVPVNWTPGYFGKLISNSSDILVVLDMQGITTYISDSVKKVLGYHPGEMLNKPAIEFVYPADMKKVKRYFNKLLLTSGNTVSCEHRQMHKNGSIVYLETIGANMFHDPDIQGVVLNARDVTERKIAEIAARQAKEELEESEKKFRNLFETSMDGIIKRDMDGNILEANQAYIKMLGYSNLQEMHQHYRDLTPEKWHDFEDAIIKKQVFARGFSDVYEKEYFRKDGTIFPVNLRVWQASKNRHLAGTWGIVRDITARKETENLIFKHEQYLQTILQTTADGFWVVDPHKKIIDVNNAYCRMTGYTASELLRMTINDLDALKHPDETAAHINRIISNGSELFETRHRRKDGSIFDVEISATWINIDGGRMVCFCHDITQRKLTQARLQTYVEQLDLLNRHQLEVRESERATLATDIHDELGQAMTALRIDLNRVMENLENTTYCQERITKMIGITNDTIHNIRRMCTDLRPGMLDDLGLAPALEWYCEEFATRTGIDCQLKVNYPDDKNSSIELTLYRVVQESLTNVARHASASNVSIDLHCSNQAILLTIEDDGVGIPANKLTCNKSFGLIGMRERVGYCGGEITIGAGATGGTKLQVKIPLPVTVT